MRSVRLLLVALFLVPAAISAGPNDGIFLAVHGNVSGIETSDICDIVPPSCEELIPSADPDADGIEWYVIVAVSPDQNAPNFSTIIFGIGPYDPALCNIVFHGACHPELNPVEVPSPEWPGPNSGTAVSWAPDCLTERMEPVYYLGLYSYGPGQLPLGDFNPGHPSVVVGCSDLEEDPIVTFGALGCGGAPGANPSCEGDPIGACCFDGVCILMPDDGCLSQGGEFYPGLCEPNPCPQPTGACCLDGICEVLTEAECAQEGGEWSDEPCDPNPCLQPIGACCFGQDCIILPRDECLVSGGDWFGGACDPLPCDPPPPGSNDGIILVVHGNVEGIETNGDPCVDLAPPSCDDIVSSATPDPNGVEWFLLLAVSPEGNATNFNGVAFGVGDYDPGLCSIAFHGPCHADLQPVEVSSPDWPGPLSGTAVSWAPNCLTGTVEPIYYMGVYSDGPGRIPLGDYFPSEPAAVLSCMSPPEQDRFQAFGTLGCGGDPGFNPPCPDGEVQACCIGPDCFMLTRENCLASGGQPQGDGTDCSEDPCYVVPPTATEATTWGKIKAMYR
jgi:hypothetical protein